MVSLHSSNKDELQQRATMDFIENSLVQCINDITTFDVMLGLSHEI